MVAAHRSGALLLADGEEKDKPRFYNVDRYQELRDLQNSRPRPGQFTRLLRRTRLVVGSFGGLLIALSAIPVMFMGLIAVYAGYLFGPLGFAGVFVGTLGLLSLYVDRKVGKSLEFGDYSVFRRGLAQLLGFGIALGLIFFLIRLAGILSFL